VKLRPARLLPILVIGAAVPLLVPVAAPAQVDDLRSQAEALNADLERIGSEIATLGEQLDAAQGRLDRAEETITDAQQRIGASEAHIRELRLLIAERAAAAYRTAGTDSPFDMVDAENANDVGARSKYTDTAAAKDDALVDDLNAAKQDLEHDRAVAEQAREVAQEERDSLATAKDAADAAAAEQQALLDQVEGDIEAELRRITAEQAAAAPQVAEPAPTGGDGGGSAGGGGGAPAPTGGPPPLGHGGGGAAAGYASAQVGKPYCNTNPARFGPACFDCSGLTYSSWQAGGLTIPAVSGGQGSAYPHVPLGALQPGDLITTSSWGAHVGIWVGGGYVHATKPGDVVKFVGGTGSVIDAVRPG
jgi:cell wall-associated NlpC family hydrolase/outer membrane murein-binding lipoprotein Lpp